MSILKKTMAVTRFTVSDIPKDDVGSGVLKVMTDGFKKNQIVEIDPHEEMVYGWTNLLDPFFPNFEDSSMIVGSYVCASFRVDKKKVPASILNKEIILASRRECEKKGVKFLSKQELSMIKESILDALFQKAHALPTVFDIVWDVEHKTMMLLSASNEGIEILENLVSDSFGVNIRMVFPFTLATQSVDESIVKQLTPATFI